MRSVLSSHPPIPVSDQQLGQVPPLLLHRPKSERDSRFISSCAGWHRLLPLLLVPWDQFDKRMKQPPLPVLYLALVLVSRGTLELSKLNGEDPDDLLIEDTSPISWNSLN